MVDTQQRQGEVGPQATETGQPVRRRPARDLRSLMPPLGLREYWYPALEAKRVKSRPVGLKMLGEDLVFFRDRNNEVAALWNVCPHRGGSLMHGDCHYKGTISCPYHGWTFDGEGNVLAVLPEGPDSKVPGKVTARKYPTLTLKGMVFVWMGEGGPAPPDEDIPPEFFDERSTLTFASEIWPVGWGVALENGTGDAHAQYLHRDSVRNFLMPMTPVTGPYGRRRRIVNGRAAVDEGIYGAGSASRSGRGGHPWQRTYFPALQAYWPKHRWRVAWTWVSFLARRRARHNRFADLPEEWRGGNHLPSMFRGNRGMNTWTRFDVPVTVDTSRQVYCKAVRPDSWVGRVYERVHWRLFGKWMQLTNFTAQDLYSIRHQRWDTPEHLSATDGQSRWRRLTLEARGMMEPADARDIADTPAEQFTNERDTELGLVLDRIESKL